MLASHYGFAGLHAIYAIIFGLFVFYAQIDHQRELSLQSELTFQRKLTARQKTQYEINEAPLSVLRSESGLLDSVNGTVPVYIFKRVAGEGRDMPRSMYNHADSAEDQARSYLEPDSTEREILQYLDDNYDDVILVLNSNAAIDLDWVKEYPSIKAIINAPDGLLALGDVLTGAVNPSGRTVDTFAADALRSPAAQNFGDYQYSNADGSLTKYNYVTYE